MVLFCSLDSKTKLADKSLSSLILILDKLNFENGNPFSEILEFIQRLDGGEQMT